MIGTKIGLAISIFGLVLNVIALTVLIITRNDNWLLLNAVGLIFTAISLWPGGLFK